jgi:hypothetical protein
MISPLAMEALAGELCQSPIEGVGWPLRESLAWICKRGLDEMGRWDIMLSLSLKVTLSGNCG